MFAWAATIPAVKIAYASEMLVEKSALRSTIPLLVLLLFLP